MQFTITKPKSKLCHLLSLCIALTMFQACDVDDVVGLTYDDIEQFGSYFGDPNHAVVIVHSHGSLPTAKLADGDLIDILAPVNTNDLIIANVGRRETDEVRNIHQADLSISEVEEINNKSVDNLALVIRHFKTQNKKVYVLGTGYGGYITQELIAKFGSEIADRYLVMGSRLYIENDFVEATMSGKDVFYDHNATPTNISSTPVTTIKDANLNRLFGEISKDNYLEKLKGQDLSRLTYVYAQKDELVGPISSEEYAFLDTNNAVILSSEGDHMTNIKETIRTSIKEAFDIE